MDKLPVELLSKIVDYLSPAELAKLQRVAKFFLTIARDNTLWRSLCHKESNSIKLSLCLPCYEIPAAPIIEYSADWDTSYKGEEVDWYSEYITRHSPISVSWLQDPGILDQSEGKLFYKKRETKGIGLLKGRDTQGSDKVIAPLDDGSVCIWDLSRSSSEDGRKHRGDIVGISDPGILLTDMSRSHMTKKGGNVDFVGAAECVSIDSATQRGYFGVGNLLNEVDLCTLQPISQQRYPWYVFAVSQETPEYRAPLTVATTLGLHIYDPRHTSKAEDECDFSRLDPHSSYTPGGKYRPYSPLPTDHTDYAPLFQPGPLSVLHPPLPNINSILLAGRFPVILSYDRRYIDRPQGSVHSGASLCGLATSPGMFRCYSDSNPNLQSSHSLIACGEYNGRGSLELYSLSTTEPEQSGKQRNRFALGRSSVHQNRQNASHSKLLSVAVHGTRIVYSDAEGNIRWMERDARTLVRTWNLNSDPKPRQHAQGSPSSRREAHHASNLHEPNSAQKIIPTGETLCDDELLIWTGERIGRVQFHSKGEQEDANYSVEELQDAMQNPEEAEYIDAMRRSFRTHIEQLNWMRNFGIG